MYKRVIREACELVITGLEVENICLEKAIFEGKKYFEDDKFWNKMTFFEATIFNRIYGDRDSDSDTLSEETTFIIPRNSLQTPYTFEEIVDELKEYIGIGQIDALSDTDSDDSEGSDNLK